MSAEQGGGPPPDVVAIHEGWDPAEATKAAYNVVQAQKLATETGMGSSDVAFNRSVAPTPTGGAVEVTVSSPERSSGGQDVRVLTTSREQLGEVEGPAKVEYKTANKLRMNASQTKAQEMVSPWELKVGVDRRVGTEKGVVTQLTGTRAARASEILQNRAARTVEGAAATRVQKIIDQHSARKGRNQSSEGQAA